MGRVARLLGVPWSLMACGGSPPAPLQDLPRPAPSQLGSPPPAVLAPVGEQPLPTQPGSPLQSQAKPALPCAGLDSGLARAALGDCAGLALDEEGRLRVVVESEGPVALPQDFLLEVEAGGLIQGLLPPEQLCALAASDGVSRVRLAHQPSHKQAP